MAVLVPVYWRSYGPTNFLYFCDVALFMTLVALWFENPLWASMPLVGIFLPQLLWQVDFIAGLIGVSVFGMTDYMFDEARPIFLRGLSLFHFWLPLLLLWLVFRLGYDRRALPAWTVLSWVLVLVCYWLMPPPIMKELRAYPDQPVNINYVYGLKDDVAQSWMPQGLYVVCLMAFLPICLYLPTHLMLRKVFYSATR
jgi:hypothetical protein